MPRRTATKKIEKITDLVPDPKNANQHSERGMSLLENSLRNLGAGRSIVASKEGVIIAGNATAEVAADIGLPIKVVPTDGRELVVVQRTDLSADDKQARELALADNRVGEINLEWDGDALEDALESGVDMQSIGFSEKEIGKFLVDEVREERVIVCPKCSARFYEGGQILEVGRLK